MGRMLLLYALSFVMWQEIKAQPITGLQIITAFHQGQVKIQNSAFKDNASGNCVSIALIKTSIATYGIGNVCLIDSSGEGYHVVLRNGTTFSMTAADMHYGRSNSYFIASDTTATGRLITSYGKTLFAILCMQRMYMPVGRVRIRTYADAVDKVNSGESTKYVHQLLGLQQQQINVKSLDLYTALLVKNRFHAAFATGGVYDEWGKITPVKQFGKYHRNVLKCGKCMINDAYQLR